MPDQEAGTKRQVLSALCSLAGVLAVGSYTRHSSEGTELQGGPSRSQNTEAWAGGTGLQRRTWGLIKRRGRARGPGVTKDALAFPRPHWWLTGLEGHTVLTLTALTPESRSCLLSRQTEGGQSFQRLATPAAWVGLCTRAVNSHRLGDFVSFHFFPAIKVIDSIHNIHSKGLRHPTFQRQPLLTSFFFLHIIHVS